METEKIVEQYLRKLIEKEGGMCYKFVSPGRDSVPDRICILPGIIAFVECKAPGKKPSPKQHRELQRLANLKMNVFVVDSKRAVNELMVKLKETIGHANSEGPTPVPEKGDSSIH